MVRVGGGWDTLQHFLERHGGEDAPDISPSDLLPMDTRPEQSRRRSSHQVGSPAVVAQQSSPTQVDKSPAPSVMSQPVSTTPTASAPGTVMRRCMSSTPVSRRSSLSSPEPWSGSSIASSGYTSSCGNGSAANSIIGTGRPPSRQTSETPVSRRSSVCSTPSTELRQIRRRSMLPEASGKNRLVNRSSLGLNLTSSPKTGSITAPCSPTKVLPGALGVSGIKPPNRYHNYLSSSQHITTPRNPNSGQCVSTPSSAARRASLRAF